MMMPMKAVKINCIFVELTDRVHLAKGFVSQSNFTERIFADDSRSELCVCVVRVASANLVAPAADSNSHKLRASLRVAGLIRAPNRRYQPARWVSR